MSPCSPAWRCRTAAAARAADRASRARSWAARSRDWTRSSRCARCRRWRSQPQAGSTLSQMYSLLLWLAPLAAVYCAWRGWRERATARVLFWICCMFGLALLLTQLRMHYFGSFALYLPWLLLAQHCIERWPRTGASWSCCSVSWCSCSRTGCPAGTSWPRRCRSPGDPTLPRAAADPRGPAQGVRARIQASCSPTTMRATTSATTRDCSVIANNFLLTRQHEQKIRQIDYLTSVPATAFPGVAPFVRYILLRPIRLSCARPRDRST